MNKTIEDASKQYGFSCYKDYINITQIRKDLAVKNPDIFGNNPDKSRKRDIFAIMESKKCKDHFENVTVTGKVETVQKSPYYLTI